MGIDRTFWALDMGLGSLDKIERGNPLLPSIVSFTLFHIEYHNPFLYRLYNFIKTITPCAYNGLNNNSIIL
jgi:hypothetical protein